MRHREAVTRHDETHAGSEETGGTGEAQRDTRHAETETGRTGRSRVFV